MTEENSKSNSARQPDLENRVSVIETKVDMFIQEMRDFKAEMRDRDNQRAEDMREIRANITNLNAKIEEAGNQIHNLAVTAMMGIGAIVVAVIAFVATR